MELGPKFHMLLSEDVTFILDKLYGEELRAQFVDLFNNDERFASCIYLSSKHPLVPVKKIDQPGTIFLCVDPHETMMKIFKVEKEKYMAK